MFADCGGWSGVSTGTQHSAPSEERYITQVRRSIPSRKPLSFLPRKRHGFPRTARRSGTLSYSYRSSDSSQSSLSCFVEGNSRRGTLSSVLELVLSMDLDGKARFIHDRDGIQSGSNSPSANDTRSRMAHIVPSCLKRRSLGPVKKVLSRTSLPVFRFRIAC